MTSEEVKQKYRGVTAWRKTPKSPLRWRFRDKHGKATFIPSGLEPGTARFTAAYEAIIKGQVPSKADVIAMPGASEPKTFRQAWKLVLASTDWSDLDPQSQLKNEQMAREFMAMPIVVRKPLLWGDVPVSEMTYEDLESLQGRWAVTPSKGWHMKVMLRKIFYIARRKHWRPDDPTDLVRWKRGGGKKGGYIGWKPWPEEIRAQFETRHPIGTAARTAYALAFWIGNRRGDVANLAWEHLITIEDDNGNLVEGFEFEQQKEVQSDDDMIQFRPLSWMLREALAPLDRSQGGTVLKTGYGNKFSEKSLTGMMAHWTKQAGIEPGYTLHGLRKTYAAMIGESGATYQQQKDSLGHTTAQQVARYGKSIEKRKTTVAATRLLEAKVKKQQVRLVTKVTK